ncbi:hypothetical protein GRS48_04605 [Halorubrum sp. JWXQ-INN 858]|uniref:DUF7115 domain-containing protein n=1 Tax=Halorubrum sp. JWXQ-INN 858 TaxID=2690782 RepID=UPI001356ACC1|nr:hypothetical protein [Halorubrum sp. JWXQ-INN 858]MWV64106.1 hypothetical protein [Halorubrum sp. JWXQ-INN 858]
MSLPERLAGAVDDEDVVARVPLGGDDVLVVTPTRTLVYRAEGLLSDETVEEYGHDAERIDVSKGRRKSKLTLSYGLDGDETVTIPTKRLDDALHPVLAGVLSGVGVTEPGESVVRTFRFSELTLVVTSHRLVKHIGSAVWDGDFEEFPYADLTGLDFEEGTVATSVVLTHDGRSERFKAPNESARAVRETLTDAVCEFHGVDSVEEFRIVAAEAAEAAGADASGGGSGGTTDFGDGPDPLSASPVSDAEAEAGADAGPGPAEASGADPLAGSGRSAAAGSNEGMSVADAATGSVEPDDPLAGDPGGDPMPSPTGSAESAGSGAASGSEPAGSGAAGVDGAAGGDAGDAFEGSAFESAGVEDEDLTAEVAALRETVEQQSERLDRQAELIEQLIAELRQGR